MTFVNFDGSKANIPFREHDKQKDIRFLPPTTQRTPCFVIVITFEYQLLHNKQFSLHTKAK